LPSEESCLLRLRVVADADPIALVCILGRFQNLNVLPRRVEAELCPTEVFYVQVDVMCRDGDMLTLIATKLREMPCIRDADWHRV
jgi:hypothetical protein